MFLAQETLSHNKIHKNTCVTFYLIAQSSVCSRSLIYNDYIGIRIYTCFHTVCLAFFCSLSNNIAINPPDKQFTGRRQLDFRHGNAADHFGRLAVRRQRGGRPTPSGHTHRTVMVGGELSDEDRRPQRTER